MKKKMNKHLQVSDFRTFSSLDLSDNIRNKFPRMSMFIVDRTDKNIEYGSVDFIYATDLYDRLILAIKDEQLINDVYNASIECEITKRYDDAGDCIRDYIREVFISRLSVIFHQWNEKNAVLKIAGIMK
jgi:hypothetical protein